MEVVIMTTKTTSIVTLITTLITTNIPMKAAVVDEDLPAVLEGVDAALGTGVVALHVDVENVLYQRLVLDEGAVLTDVTVVVAGAGPGVAVLLLQVLQQLRAGK